MKKLIPIPRRDRLRAPARSFGWVDHRLLRDGHLAGLDLEAMAYYLFLVLAADRNGISYYRIESAAKHLGYLDWSAIHAARDVLVAADLVAFQPFAQHDPNGFTQVLSLDGLAVRATQ